MVKIDPIAASRKRPLQPTVAEVAKPPRPHAPALRSALGALAMIVAALVLGAFDLVMPTDPDPAIVPADVAWMLSASGLVLLMTPGLSFFYGGMVGKRNVISTMLQGFVSLGVATLVWVVVGFSLAFGDSIGGIIGNPLQFAFFRGVGLQTNAALSPSIPLLLFAFFQMKFAIITPALITGAFAERVRFRSYVVFLALFSIFIYAPLAHMTWHPNGLFRQWGVLDFAGGTVVHLTAGLAALAGAIFLGPRRSHRNRQKHTPANVPYVILGTGMLWFGWFGFNAGSALAANALAARAFATTHVASSAAMLGWLVLEALNGRKPSALGACIGAVIGLVAITPAAGYVGIGASVAIGLIATAVSHYAIEWRSRITMIDDTLDVFPSHGVGGIVGMILTAVFAEKVGLLNGTGEIFGKQMLALLIACGFAFVGSLVLFAITNVFSRLRVSADEEDLGLDLSQHDETIFEVPPLKRRLAESP